MSTIIPKWWKEGTAYQIWPASYKDSNGDGVGDLQGVMSTLDHLQELGIDYIWISPMYDSPQLDMGYDISDYENVYYKYGTLQVMNDLINQIHARGMRIILDLVVNHTSSAHKWFQESKKSKDNSFSEWYIWRDPKIVDGKKCPPNNWRSQFAGSAWTYVEERDQYYLHLFHPAMPDLNWHNEETRFGIYKSAIEFWLARGVDGFRVDVVNFYCKNESFPDAPVNEPDSEYQVPHRDCYLNGPKQHQWLKEQRAKAMDKYSHDVVLVGELHGTDTSEVLHYISAQERELDMVFDFDLSMVGAKPDFSAENSKEGSQKKPHELLAPHKLSEMKTAIMKTQGFLSDSCPVADAWPTVFLENHDLPRSVSRYGSPNPVYGDASAKVLALMAATLSGSLFLYQGQEIGMTNIPKSWTKKDIRDVANIGYLNEMDSIHPGDKAWRELAMEGVRKHGRDNARTPVQWSGQGTTAGFTSESSEEPWIRVNDNYKEGINVEDQAKDEKSVLTFWKRVLKLRKQYKDVLVYGLTEMADLENEDVMTYTKTALDGTIILLCMNFSEKEHKIVVPEIVSSRVKTGNMNLLISTSKSDPVATKDVLAPWEGRAYVV